jgi:hypothetical protein
MVNDWQAALIYLAIEVGINTVFAVIARPKNNVKGPDGEMHVKFLPRFVDNSHNRPKDFAGLFDMGLVPVPLVLIESFLYATCYGAITVVSCNWAFSQSVNHSYGWLITSFLCMCSLIFMCAFSENCIHVYTSHLVHFIYYGFGFIALALYWELPAAWIVVLVVIGRLAIHTAVKYYVWPNYPDFFTIVPLYKRDENLNIIQFSTPSPDLKKVEGMIFSCVPITVYEILHGSFASYMTYGGFIAVICEGICSSINAAYGTSLWASIITSFIFGILYLFALEYIFPGYARACRGGIFYYFFYPGCVVSVITGSIFVLSNLLKYKKTFHNSGEIETVFLVLSHLSHVVVGCTFLWSYIAAGYFFGFIKIFQRCFSPGNGGLNHYNAVSDKEEEDNNIELQKTKPSVVVVVTNKIIPFDSENP